MAEPFLNLENKEDYLDQVTALAGLPTKFKYTAAEWNLIRDKINELHQILSNTELGDAANNNVKVEFKYLDVDWSQAVAYNTFVTNKLNSSPDLVITGNELYVFYAIKNVSSFVQGANFIAEKHLWIFRKGSGTYGANGTEVHENDFIYLGHQKNNSPSLQRYLFDIGNTPISEVINLGTETYAINLGMYNIFNCTRNGDPYSYVFVTSFNVIGNYQNVPESRQVYESSFLEIGNTDPIPPSLDNFATLQEIDDFSDGYAKYYLTDVITNIGMQSPTQEFIMVETDDDFYFGLKTNSDLDFTNCRLTIRGNDKFDFPQVPDLTQNNYNFWLLGSNSDVSAPNSLMAFRYSRKNLNAATVVQKEPVENTYVDIVAMLADQNNQTDGYIQFVTDATADTTVDNGWAYYEYLDDGFGDLQDYRKLSEEESMEFEGIELPVEMTDVNGLVGALADKLALGGLVGYNAQDLKNEIDTLTGNKADKYARVNISSSGNLLPVHNGKLLIITGSVTLTYSGIYPQDFNFNLKVLSGGQLTIAKGDKILKDTEGNSVAQLVAEEHSFGTSYEVAAGEYMMEGNLS